MPLIIANFPALLGLCFNPQNLKRKNTRDYIQTLYLYIIYFI